VPVGVQDIWQHLAIESEEAIVLSAIYSNSDDGPKPGSTVVAGWVCPGVRFK